MTLARAQRYSMRQRNPEMINSYPVKNGQTIYYGALVGLDTVGISTGRLANWTDDSGMRRFCGIAIPRGTRDLPDYITGNSGGTIVCEVYEGGPTLENVAVAGLTSLNTQLGDPVYASDENTFTMSATPNVGAVGRLARYITTGYGDVQLFSALEYAANQNFGKV